MMDLYIYICSLLGLLESRAEQTTKGRICMCTCVVYGSAIGAVSFAEYTSHYARRQYIIVVSHSLFDVQVKSLIAVLTHVLSYV